MRARSGAIWLTSVLHGHAELINQRDSVGATALHYAAFSGHRAMVEELVKRGAEINAKDSEFGATPTGWAIEYLREMGGFLAIELDDMAHAIGRGEVEWVRRFLRRFPALRAASDTQGKPFRLLAQESGNQEIGKLFGGEYAVRVETWHAGRAPTRRSCAAPPALSSFLPLTHGYRRGLPSRRASGA